MSLFPFIEVFVNGAPVNGFFYERLVSATIHDAPGQEADNCSFRFDDAGNNVPIPNKGALLLARFGFRDGFGVATSQKMGLFTYEKTSIEGGDEGEFITISGRSADMRSDLKEQYSEHFQDTTVGEIVSTLANRHQYQVKVDDELASIKIPYIARYERGSADFLTHLADRFGALFSPKGGKFVFVKRGILGPVTISKYQCEGWSFDIEPRPLYGKVEAGWYDRKTNQVFYEAEETGLDGSTKRIRRVLPTKEEASAAAKSEGQRLGRATGSGSLTLAGRPDIMADAPIVTEDFRSECNGPWRCAGVDHVYQDTYMTTVEIEAPEEGKT